MVDVVGSGTSLPVVTAVDGMETGLRALTAMMRLLRGEWDGPVCRFCCCCLVSSRRRDEGESFCYFVRSALSLLRGERNGPVCRC